MEKKPCLRCERLIDPYARICPFCNWDQELAPPKETPLAASMAREDEMDVAAEARRQKRKRVLLIVGVVVSLLATFAIGSVVARLGRKPHTPEEDTPSAISQRPTQGANQLTDLRLVNVDLTSTVGGSITSVPQSGAPAGPMASDPSDATALPSAQYAELVRQSTNHKVPASTGADTLDPRTIVAPPIPQIRRPAPPSPAPQASAATAADDERPAVRDDGDSITRTRPEPISQPLPSLNVEGTARFRLRVGADGSVKEIDVLESIPGATPRLISSIQQWKFKPATENGRPVEGVHLVDVSFKARND
ncbi:MAG TPA: energy transducer TonB [Thermoanaerobaculia bacterium]|nr:energy transducer TonB [Thermoanaerobaculia bacterium]